MPSKLLRVKTVAVAGLAMLSVGGMAAAATGLASASAERAAATPASSRASGGQVGHAQGDAAKAHVSNAAAATNDTGPDTASDHATGPDASGAAKHGLCQAWNAGQGDDHGKRADAPAFQALAAAAGGADQIAAYCEDELGEAATRGQRPATPPGGAAVRTPPTTGPPEDPGQGNGQGGRPTTT